MNHDCELCGDAARRRFTEVVGGQARSVHLCERCARDRGFVDEPLPPTLAKIEITQVTATLGSPGLPAVPRRCPGCGTNLVAIRKSGRVGCEECYRVFRDHLEPLLRRVHGELEHCGARPSLEDPVPALREELQRAILEEDFERAAHLRDRISRAGGDSPQIGPTL